MTRRLSTAMAALAALALAMMAVLTVGTAGAQGGPPPSEDGVVPILDTTNNIRCATLNANNTTYPTITSDFGFKIDANPSGGTYYFIAGTQNGNGTTLTGGAPSDSVNYVTVTPTTFDSGGKSTKFDWTASLSIDAVIVKAQDSYVYIYEPEDIADGDLQAPELKAISHVEFCYDYELTATKTANAQYTRTYTWTIEKTASPTAHSGFAGDTFSSDYDIVVERNEADSDFAVAGTITVNNPTPFTVSFSVSDSVGGAAAVVDCNPNAAGNQSTGSLAPGASAVCTYSASLASKTNGTNTATISSSTSGVGGATASASYTFGAPTTKVGYETVNVTDTFPYPGGSPEALGSASGDKTFDNDQSFACSDDPDDYTNGKYTYTKVNRAEITETEQFDDANVTVTCYAPVVTKDASASYDETHTWSIEKSVDPESQSGVVGDTLGWEWTVKVSETSADSNFAVSGTIYVKNPNPGAPMTVTVSDKLSDGTTATVNCGGGSTSLTVPAGQTGTCSYSAAPGGKTATKNTATAKLNGISFTGSADVSFVKNVIGGTANVTDDQIGLDEDLTAGQGPWEYPGSGSHTCSTNPDDYNSNGSYSGSEDNTATVTASSGQTDSDDASTTYTCYAPVVTKNGAGKFDKRYTWNITKSVSPTSQSGYPGDVLGWTWTVKVTNTSAEEGFRVAGTIYVKNPSPSEPMTVDVADTLGDNTVATVDCGGGSTSLTIPAGQTKTCSYSASPANKSVTTNTATATISGATFSGSTSFSWSLDKVFNGTATVNDPTAGISNVVINGGASEQTITRTGSHTCATSASTYGSDGVYSATVNNTATVTGSSGQTASSSASTTYTCEAGFVDLLKKTNGAVDPTFTWNFALYNGPKGFGTTPIGSSSTFNDVDGVLTFGGPALSPNKTYTICELSVPAGYSSLWMVNGVIVNPYNPDAGNVPEDLGNRCVDFGKGTTIPVSVGTTVHFEVNNTRPGGDPRTPGYWKNWNRCTGGGQAANAARNGGWQKGFWLLEDVLNPSVGGGITWDDIINEPGTPSNPSDGYTLYITSCEQAVEILDQRVVSVNGKVGDGKKLASDAARTLAMHLLAAQLNFGAGACTTPTVLAKALAAETLLDNINFNPASGSTFLSSRHALYADAISLAKYLDQYNNGMYCGSLNP